MRDGGVNEALDIRSVLAPRIDSDPFLLLWLLIATCHDGLASTVNYPEPLTVVLHEVVAVAWQVHHLLLRWILSQVHRHHLGAQRDALANETLVKHVSVYPVEDIVVHLD